MLSLKVFNFNSNPIGVEQIDGVLWFNAAQICKALGYKNPAQALNDHVRPKYIRQIRDPKKGGRPPKYISESGLYELLAKCDREIAREFQDWLYEDALPSIARGKQVESKMPFVCLDEVLDALCVAIVRSRGNIPNTNPRFKVLDKATVKHQGTEQACQIMAIAGIVVDVVLECGTHILVHESRLSNPVPYAREPKTAKFKTEVFKKDLKRQSQVRAIYVEKPSVSA